jgi:ribosomal peptide maturation radical SAM protein 1
MNKPDRVLLAYMPFGLIQTASLGLSLLKAALTRRGIACDIRYFNLEFVDACIDARGGNERSELYARLSHRHQLTFAAESRVADLLFGRDAARQQIIAPHVAAAQPDERAFLSVLPERFERFLTQCVESIDWSRYRVLGLGSIFLGMTVPSVLFAREVKRRFPHVATVLGGPNTEGPMGEVLARRCPDIDYVLRGEADESWPALVDALMAERDPGPIPGLVRRFGDGLQVSPARPVERMDGLPFPDFDDFIQAAARTSFRVRYETRLRLPFESSRGCWWGEKSHCKFCGINALGMGYRSKSRDRLVAEIEWLVDRYRPDLLMAADAILDKNYFGTLLPMLAARRTRVALSYEVKANLTRSNMQEIRDAGITEILPGIETFSTRLLKLMKKGASSLDNLACLRLAEEHGVKVSWFHMCGLPGESVEDYRRNVATIRTIPHLHPPREIARFTLQRFTPYLNQAAAEGLGNVRPMAEYRAVFPWPDDDLRDLAYHFDFEFTDGRDPGSTDEIESMLEAAVVEWKARYGHVALEFVHAEQGAVIVDTRQPAAVVYALDAESAALYLHLDRPHTAETLSHQPQVPPAAATARDDTSSTDVGQPRSLLAEADYLCETLAATLVVVSGPSAGTALDRPAHQDAVRVWLERLAAQDLVHHEGERFLALAVARARDWLETRYGYQALSTAS